MADSCIRRIAGELPACSGSSEYGIGRSDIQSDGGCMSLLVGIVVVSELCVSDCQRRIALWAAVVTLHFMSATSPYRHFNKI